MGEEEGFHVNVFHYNCLGIGYDRVTFKHLSFVNTLTQAGKNDSAGKGTCYQAWPCEFNPRNHKVGGER